jgi:hypothetical protein
MTLRLRGHFLLEIYYHWRQQPHLASLVDSGTLRFWQPLGPTSREGVWVQEGMTLSPGTTWRVELDLLPREVFGRLIYLGFHRLKLLWLVNRAESEGLLQFGPPSQEGWIGPWNAQTKILLPPGNPFFWSFLPNGWPVTTAELAVEFTALEGPARFDLLLLGDLHELPGSGPGDFSGGSSDASESSSSSVSDSSSSESSEGGESSEDSGSSEWSSEDSSDSSYSSYDDSSWS